MTKNITPSTESPQQILKKVYHELDYNNGNLLEASELPTENNINKWLESGDWLALAKKVGADKVFFVDNEPVIVFSSFNENLTNENKPKLLNMVHRTWCMARPYYLFVALPGELKIYHLNYALFDKDNPNGKEPITIPVQLVDQVFKELADYHRANIESGNLPQDKRFGKPDERADRHLINNLKIIRQRLINNGLRSEHAHALIGRAIFVRYLEDRGIITPTYFEQVTAQNTAWQDLLNKKTEEEEKTNIILEEQWEKRRFYQVLQDREFTYALFNKLAQDFNGDLFPQQVDEQHHVTQTHLTLLQKFLLDDADIKQEKLFLWAYDFEIIPIDLISNIYEEFYQSINKSDTGTHYTPTTLVEFALREVLTKEKLATNPVILDPACGSAIFLVEAFRRIVRYQVQQKQRMLNASELHQILQEQLRGIEINREAIYVAAFSLHLALLNYQEPEDIQTQMSLPHKPLAHLIYDANHQNEANYYQVLFHINTFDLMDSEREILKDNLDSEKRFKGRSKTQKLFESSAVLPFKAKSIDIIVGNPPWGFLKKKQASPELIKAQNQAITWCEQFDWSIGDKELSQAFIARTLSLLKPHGVCGLLVSTGIIWKQHGNSQKFRQKWLEQCTLKKLVNFAHVRDVFFEGAIAPFTFIHYQVIPPTSNDWVQYWSMKKTHLIYDETHNTVRKIVLLQLPDIRQVRQLDLMQNEQLWKVYWWGNHFDAHLIQVLNLDESLETFADKDKKGKLLTGRGYQGPRESVENNPSGWLTNYKELPVKKLKRYGILPNTAFSSPPQSVQRQAQKYLYEGWRLLIKLGIDEENNLNGYIIARLEDEPYCFNSSIYSLRIDTLNEQNRKIIIAILWSSLARYYYFMTSGSWVIWHPQIYVQTVSCLPIRLPADESLRQRIVDIVDKLRNWDDSPSTLTNPKPQPNETLASLEQQLDEAIFELYELSEAERDLVLDMCEVGLEFFYRHANSNAVKPVEIQHHAKQGVMTDLPQNRNKEQGLEGYLYAFLSIWQRKLKADGEFFWQIISHKSMLAVIFTTHPKNHPLPQLTTDDETQWQQLLQTHATSFEKLSNSIYIAGMIRMVTANQIIIIKQNEHRLWTRSLAREDAEATMLQMIQLQRGLKTL